MIIYRSRQNYESKVLHNTEVFHCTVSDRVTKPLRSFSSIETFLDYLNAFGLCSNMLELLLEFLWSKTLSAASFGRYWGGKQEFSYGSVYHNDSKRFHENSYDTYSYFFWKQFCLFCLWWFLDFDRFLFLSAHVYVLKKAPFFPVIWFML